MKTTPENIVIPQIKVTLISESTFLSMKDEWDSLISRSVADELFLSWSWTTVWWKVWGGNKELYILEARDSRGSLIGVAPMYIFSRYILVIVFWYNCI